MQQPDIHQLLALIQTPEGQQLLSYLNTNGGAAAKNAASQAAAGDLTAARSSIAPLLDAPEVQALLRRLKEAL